MALSLIVHARYHDVQCGIFDGDTVLLTSTHESKKISGQFTLLFDDLLQRTNHTLSDLSYIAVHQGPAPFTTIRVCLAAANGISFATGIPLIGVSGLEALLDQYVPVSTGVTIGLLNAFSNELFVAVHDPHTASRTITHGSVDEVLNNLRNRYSGPCTFVGNGSLLHQEAVRNCFGTQATIIDSDVASLEHIAVCAQRSWDAGVTTFQVLPLYLKDYVVRSSRPQEGSK